MHNDSITVVLPLIAIMLAGYLAGRVKLLPENGSMVISRFVFLVAMPAFIFISLARIPVEDFFNWPYLAVLGGGKVPGRQGGRRGDQLELRLLQFALGLTGFQHPTFQVA